MKGFTLKKTETSKDKVALCLFHSGRRLWNKLPRVHLAHSLHHPKLPALAVHHLNETGLLGPASSYVFPETSCTVPALRYFALLQDNVIWSQFFLVSEWSSFQNSHCMCNLVPGHLAMYKGKRSVKEVSNVCDSNPSPVGCVMFGKLFSCSELLSFHCRMHGIIVTYEYFCGNELG